MSGSLLSDRDGFESHADFIALKNLLLTIFIVNDIICM